MEKPKHRFNLILPQVLWKRIQALAERNRRPITQEILLAIEEHLDRVGETTAPSAVEKGDPR